MVSVEGVACASRTAPLGACSQGSEAVVRAWLPFAAVAVVVTLQGGVSTDATRVFESAAFWSGAAVAKELAVPANSSTADVEHIF